MKSGVTRHLSRHCARQQRHNKVKQAAASHRRIVKRPGRPLTVIDGLADSLHLFPRASDPPERWRVICRATWIFA